MKITRVLSIVCVVCFVVVGICAAKDATAVNREDAIALARTYTQAQRQTVVAVNLQLTSEESTAFWPVYNAYQAALEPLRDRLVKLIVSYSDKFDTLSDADAKAMLEELLNIQETEGKVRREFMPQFEAVLPMKKVVRFYQIDNKINAEIRYQLSLEIPLLEIAQDK